MRNIDLKMAEINKKYKSDIINEGTQLIEVSKIPFSSPLANWMTYGGIPVGKITEFFGGEGGGKTTSALDICANAQMQFLHTYQNKCDKIKSQIKELKEKNTKESLKQLSKLEIELKEVIERGPRLVVYVDTEQTLDTEWAQLLGVDTEAMILVRPQEQTAEQVLQIIIDLVNTGDAGLIVLDSIPCLVPQQIFDETMEKKSYGGISQPLTTFCSKILSILNIHQCAFIGINQIREDLGSMYNTISTPGGRGWKHSCSLRLRFKKDTFLDSNNLELTSRAENPAGNRVAIEITKTKVCKPDRRVGYYTLNYTDGIDIVFDSIIVAKQYRLIVQAGSWYRIVDNEGNVEKDGKGTELSFQGISNLQHYLLDNDDIFQSLIKRLNKLMNI